MKKVIALTLIIYYLYSFAYPYVPVICNFISKTIWEHSHKEKVKNLSPRSSILIVLKDMAENNSPKKSNIPISDSLISSSFSYLEVLCKIDFSIFLFESNRKLFIDYLEDLSLIFRNNPAPPPKFA